MQKKKKEFLGGGGGGTRLIQNYIYFTIYCMIKNIESQDE